MIHKINKFTDFLLKNRRGCLCVLGSFLLSLALSLDYSYPNLNTYITSYLRTNGKNPTVSYEDFIFVTAGKNLTQGLLSWLGGYISIKLGVKRTLSIGCVILIVGYTCTYWAIGSYFWTVMMTVGYFHGLAFVSVYSVASGTAQRWFPPERRGLVASIVASGYGFGSVMWIPTETAFVNPDNVDPVSACGLNMTQMAGCDEKYFMDPDVLGRIPYCFLLLGGIVSGLSLLGLCLVSVCEKAALEAKQELPSLDMKEVIRTKIFYQIWWGFFTVSVTHGLLINWQKSYGLSLVTSDAFHAKIGIFTNVCNGLCRIVWGYFYDRFGFKRCIIVIASCVTLGALGLPLLTFMDVDSTAVTVLYTAIMIMFYCVLPGTYAVVTPSIMTAFGPDFFAPNLGLLYTATLFYFGIIMIVSQIPALFAVMGYSGMFVMAGVFGLLGILVTCFMPQDISYERKNKRALEESREEILLQNKSSSLSPGPKAAVI